MKKYFSVLMICIGFYGLAQSQPCTVNLAAIDSGFMYPPTDSLPCIEQGSSYSGTIQINMPGMFHGTVLLDSLFVDSITGLPAGVNWSSYPSSPFVLYGDSSGCVTFSGTTNADTGTYSLTFYCHATVTGQSAGVQNLSYQQLLEIGDAPIPFYDLSLIAPGDSCYPQLYTTGIPFIAGTSNWSMYPNPIADGGREQLVVGNEWVGSDIDIFDGGGKLVYHSVIQSAYSEIYLNLASGIYLARIHSANNSAVKKLAKL